MENLNNLLLIQFHVDFFCVPKHGNGNKNQRKEEIKEESWNKN